MALGVTAYLFSKSETARRAETAAGENFNDKARLAARGILDLRSAQQAYVATGQGPDFWAARVTSTLTSLQRQPRRPARCRAVDGRARQHRRGQRIGAGLLADGRPRPQLRPDQPEPACLRHDLFERRRADRRSRGVTRQGHRRRAARARRRDRHAGPPADLCARGRGGGGRPGHVAAAAWRRERPPVPGVPRTKRTAAIDGQGSGQAAGPGGRRSRGMECATPRE